MTLAAVSLAASGLLNLLVLLLIGGLLAAVVYYVLGLFAPHPIPAIAAIIVFLVVLLYALGGP